MSEHIVKIKSAEFILHNVRRFVVERPDNYSFTPGQATDVSLNLPEWKENLHPFTFTGPPEADFLEFTIKIYPERNGITKELGTIKPGAELILHDVFGTIEYKGPGVFIAGGAGVTPFIGILRDLHRKNKIAGNFLIFSNKTFRDVILKEEFEKMLGKNFISLLSEEIGHHIDRKFLTQHIHNFLQHFYVCGPDEFTTFILDQLTSLGASPEAVVFEK